MKIKFWPTVGTVIGLAILLSLAVWQTRRYLHKSHAEQLQKARADKPTVDLRGLEGMEADRLNYRNVRLHGEVDSATSLVFKHRFYNGDPGVWLLQPVQLTDGGQVLVNRGWVPFDRARGADALAELPPLGDGPYRGLVHVRDKVIADAEKRRKLEAGELELRGRTTRWDTFDLEAAYDALEEGPEGGKARPTPEAPLVMVLSEEHSGPRYPIASTDHLSEPFLTSGRHLSYAVFWYAVALALLAMYVANALGYLTSGNRELRRQ